jgi:hypothetical protein
LLQVFAHHQGQVEGKTDVYYGRPIGALAFAATAVSLLFLSIEAF